MICSFCAKPKERVAHIITGYGTAAICNLCVDVCKTICESKFVRASALTPQVQNVDGES